MSAKTSYYPMRARRPHPALDPAIRTRLASACDRLGLRTVAQAAGVNHMTLASALAGAPVLAATARVLALAALDLEPALPASA